MPARADARGREADGTSAMNTAVTRTTPRTTIEAILWCVRERGVEALREAANIERLLRCDSTARAEINERITRGIASRDVAA